MSANLLNFRIFVHLIHRKSKMTFLKYQGAGNDFLIADNTDGAITLDTASIQALCDRHYGFGSDGLMLLERSDKADFRMTFYNPDGSGGMMCGNGGRCIAAFAARVLGKREFVFEAADGMHQAKVTDADESLSRCTVTLKMTDVRIVERMESEQGWFLDTGTRHFVKLCKEPVRGMDIIPEGRRLRHSPLFAPQGTNVNFAFRHGKTIDVRTFEKGVEDETYACGTGIVASAIASWHESPAVSDLGTNVHFEVNAKKDRLSVDFIPLDGKDGIRAAQVWLTGPATLVGSVTAAETLL